MIELVKSKEEKRDIYKEWLVGFEFYISLKYLI